MPESSDWWYRHVHLASHRGNRIAFCNFCKWYTRAEAKQFAQLTEKVKEHLANEHLQGPVATG